MNALRPLRSFVCAACRRQQQQQPSAVSSPSARTFVSSAAHSDAITRAFRQSSRPSPFANLADSLLPGNGSSAAPEPKGAVASVPHRLHVYSTKHNTHITFTQPPQKDPSSPGKSVDVLLSLSAGNIGFKKAGRGSYDAGYQLAAFVLKQIQERGLLRDLRDLEVIMRGFGKGRDAVTKALLGSEGHMVRDKIRSVKDATRLKFGGTRSPKPRRLG